MVVRLNVLFWTWPVATLVGLLVFALTWDQTPLASGWWSFLSDLAEAFTAGIFVALTIAQSAATAFEQGTTLRKETKDRIPGQFMELRAPLFPINNLCWLATAVGASRPRPVYIVASVVLLLANTLLLFDSIAWTRMKRAAGLRSLPPALLLVTFALVFMLSVLIGVMSFVYRDVFVHYRPAFMIAATTFSVFFVVLGLGGQLCRILKSRSVSGVDLSTHRASVARSCVGLVTAYALMRSDSWLGGISLGTTALGIVFELGILWFGWRWGHESATSLTTEEAVP